jgi:hypothetical protein
MSQERGEEAIKPASEAELLARLDRLVSSGRVQLAVDRSKLSSIDFPLLLESYGNRWAYALAVLTGLVWWQFGTVAGVAAAIGAAVIYQTAGRAAVARRLQHEIRERGLKDTDTWRRLWRFGGVVLTFEDGAHCRGPDGNWMRLVRAVDRPEGTG